MIRIGLLLLAVGLCLSSASTVAKTLREPVRDVESGDTFILQSGKRIRLYGIDAPEVTQQCARNKKCVPCGVAARDALYALSAGTLTCEPRGKAFNAILARCFNDRGDIGQKLLASGHAVVFRMQLTAGQSLPSMYDYAEAAAKKDGKGIWAGTMISPWKWRHGGRRLPCEWN